MLSIRSGSIFTEEGVYPVTRLEMTTYLDETGFAITAVALSASAPRSVLEEAEAYLWSSFGQMRCDKEGALEDAISQATGIRNIHSFFENFS